MDIGQRTTTIVSNEVLDARGELTKLLKTTPIPDSDLIRNLGLYTLPMEMKRLLFFASIYEKILEVPGVIMEFGSGWGQNLAFLQSLRSILEPYHHRRSIIGFDTFSGFRQPAPEDGSSSIVQTGNFSVTAGYEDHLTRVLALRETQSPLPEVTKFRILKGNASEQLASYLEEHPETIIAFAYFDMDLYEPTLDCLGLIKSRLTKGSVVGFDELNHQTFPGETAAVKDALGLQNIALRRSKFSSDECYFIV